MNDIIPVERIYQSILFIRGKKVMLDRDIAALYGVRVKVLKQAVKRNISRFPNDFMFQLTTDESQNLRSQIVTSSLKHGGARYSPMVFTEYGVVMLSSVLRSETAVQVNVQIVRAFILLRDTVLNHADLQRKIEVLEMQYDENFRIVFDGLRRLLTEESKPKPVIGFETD